MGFRSVTACALLRGGGGGWWGWGGVGGAAEVVTSEVVNSPHDNNSLRGHFSWTIFGSDRCHRVKKEQRRHTGFLL